MLDGCICTGKKAKWSCIHHSATSSPSMLVIQLTAGQSLPHGPSPRPFINQPFMLKDGGHAGDSREQTASQASSPKPSGNRQRWRGQRDHERGGGGGPHSNSRGRPPRSGHDGSDSGTPHHGGMPDGNNLFSPVKSHADDAREWRSKDSGPRGGQQPPRRRGDPQSVSQVSQNTGDWNFWTAVSVLSCSASCSGHVPIGQAHPQMYKMWCTEGLHHMHCFIGEAQLVLSRNPSPCTNSPNALTIDLTFQGCFDKNRLRK